MSSVEPLEPIAVEFQTVGRPNVLGQSTIPYRTLGSALPPARSSSPPLPESHQRSGGGAAAWETRVKGMEVRHGLSSAQWLDTGSFISKLMDQLATKSDMQALFARVSLLERSLRTSRESVHSEVAAVPMISRADLDAAASDSASLAELFDLIVDERLAPPSELEEIALSALDSKDSDLRASASRLVALLSPSIAKDALPPLIKQEKNPYSKAIMIGALRAALV